MKQTGPHYAKYIYKFEINKDREFLRVFLPTLPLRVMKIGAKQVFYMNRVMELYILYTQICKIQVYETFVNMFVFSLNRLTPSRGEGV